MVNIAPLCFSFPVLLFHPSVLFFCYSVRLFLLSSSSKVNPCALSTFIALLLLLHCYCFYCLIVSYVFYIYITHVTSPLKDLFFSVNANTLLTSIACIIKPRCRFFLRYSTVFLTSQLQHVNPLIHNCSKCIFFQHIYHS